MKVMVFGYLSTDDFPSLKVVSKRLKSAASDTSLHTNIRFRRKLQVSSTLLHKYVSQYHSNLESINFCDCFRIPS